MQENDNLDERLFEEKEPHSIERFRTMALHACVKGRRNMNMKAHWCGHSLRTLRTR